VREHWLDELAIVFASGGTRRDALRRAGWVAVGALLGGLGLSGTAEAAKGGCPADPKACITKPRPCGTGTPCPSHGKIKCCGFGYTCCDGFCSVLSWDSSNCGACGVACPSDDYDCCDGACKNTLSNDVANCGGCNKKCLPGADCCGGVCKNTLSDVQNCGGCGIKCPAGWDCCSGECRAPSSFYNCGGSCTTCKPDFVCCSTPSGNGCCDASAPTCCPSEVGGGCCEAGFPVCCSPAVGGGCCSADFPVCCVGFCCAPNSVCGPPNSFICTAGAARAAGANISSRGQAPATRKAVR
jgi:stigma-specific protein Stig1